MWAYSSMATLVLRTTSNASAFLAVFVPKRSVFLEVDSKNRLFMKEE